MADTSRWSLQQCADAAGRYVEPEPEAEYVPPARKCLGCGADLGERRTNGGMYVIYCGRACVEIQRRRRTQHAETLRTLTFDEYVW